MPYSCEVYLHSTVHTVHKHLKSCSVMYTDMHIVKARENLYITSIAGAGLTESTPRPEGQIFPNGDWRPF